MHGSCVSFGLKIAEKVLLGGAPLECRRRVGCFRVSKMEGAAGELDVAMADKKRARDGAEDVAAAVAPIAESGEGTVVCNGETLERVETKRVRIEQEEITDGLVEAVAVSRTEVAATTTATAEPLTTELEGVQIVNITTETVENVTTVGDVSIEKEAPEGEKKGTNIPGGGKPGKKRKIAMLLAYCGAGYQGMQRNPGAITIEGELEQALFRAGAISQCNFGDLRKVDWMRAARTDKGVSAVGQIASARLVIDPQGFLDRVNQHLPKQISVFGYSRVTSNFNAKQMCDRRRYEYIVPVFAFDPAAYRDRATVLAWTAKRDLEKSQRIERRKALEKKDADAIQSSGNAGGPPASEVGLGANALLDEKSLSKALEEETEGTEVSRDGQQNGVLQLVTPESVLKDKLERPPSGECQESDTVVNVVEKAVLEEEKEDEQQAKFVFGELQLKRLRYILSKYVGTHNFHNFTARIKPEDPSAKRYILSFEARDIFEVQGMQFVRCQVMGQSFMLHQIRKMIGMAIAIMRGCTPDSIIDTALRRDADVNVPMAPELGLFLDECFYTAYNTKFSNTHEEISQKGFEKDIQNFKQNVIYSHIASSEVKDGIMAMWLHSLNDLNYPDFVKARELEKVQ